ncbi:MAG: hypothetical protein PUJ51_13295 [Clostridiales bacterium]|uniref:hypothetical protein n=1 Tax=Terrisporobacter sp. TaxID=1965305 RepID=UPI002A54FAAF|nr:hypothetical protein [Terrisporobacter sp.]MDD7755460.1 hypothetical protein [Clostridiales bacterium]MDY4133932.1 hypothetical protein [Terrisporobacter sp.]
MKYKLNPILQKLLEEKLNIHYNDYVIFLKCNMLESSIYILFDKNKIKFLQLITSPNKGEISSIGECESFSVLGIENISESNKDMSVFNFSTNKNKTINNLKSNNFKFIDDSAQFNKSIFEIDFSTEIYFKMGGEIEFIKIFN